MKIRRLIRRLRIEVRLYWDLFRDKRTPRISKILIIGAVIYLVWPFDLIPDFIPFAGFVDEIIIIPTLFYLATLFIPKSVVNEYKNKATKSFKNKFDNVQEGEIVK